MFAPLNFHTSHDIPTWFLCIWKAGENCFRISERKVIGRIGKYPNSLETTKFHVFLYSAQYGYAVPVRSILACPRF